MAERDETGRFVLGNKSGHGRLKGLASLVRAQTRDGADLVQFYVGIFGGDYPVHFRMEAAAWLADRGFGRSVQSSEIDVTTRGEQIAGYISPKQAAAIRDVLLGVGD